MKSLKIIICSLIIVLALSSAKAQDQEIAQLALNIEKLAQFKQILSDLKKGYDILNKGYGTVKDISEGNFSIHKTFLDGLYAVSPEVRKYRRVAQIIEYQLILMREYKNAYQRFRSSGVLRPEEIIYLAQVYQRLIDSSLRNIEELTMIITAGQLRMSDDERLRSIDSIYDDMEDKVMFLRSFNNQTSVMVMQRQRIKNDVLHSKNLQGIRK